MRRIELGEQEVGISFESAAAVGIPKLTLTSAESPATDDPLNLTWLIPA